MTDFPQTVLVVEDEALLLFSIAEDLREAGFKVCEARDADEALRQLEARPEISVMFTDIDIPGSMNGLRLSAAVRDKWPPVKIVVTSGMRKPSADALPEGGLFVPKPYASETVAATIQGLFR